MVQLEDRTLRLVDRLDLKDGHHRGITLHILVTKWKISWESEWGGAKRRCTTGCPTKPDEPGFCFAWDTLVGKIYSKRIFVISWTTVWSIVPVDHFPHGSTKRHKIWHLARFQVSPHFSSYPMNWERGCFCDVPLFNNNQKTTSDCPPPTVPATLRRSEAVRFDLVGWVGWCNLTIPNDIPIHPTL